MNTSEACAILEIPTGSSMEDVKKAFRKKAAELHPDKNPDNPTAEAEFKKVNTAFQHLEKFGTKHIPVDFENFSSGREAADFAEELHRNMNSFFGGTFRRPQAAPFPFQGFNPEGPFGRGYVDRCLNIKVDIPFEISILGGKKDIAYERNVKCEACTTGTVSSNKVKCQKCNGQGHRMYGGIRRVEGENKDLPCTNCKGTGFVTNLTASCTECSGTGTKKILENMHIVIPAGVENGLHLILQGRGNYNTSLGVFENLIIIVSVIPDHDMKRNGLDVISVIELTLLEALKGTKKKLRTVHGDKTLSINPKTKNKDTIRVSGFGVAPNGSHEFVINVNYPENVSDIIQVLESKDELPEEISVD